MIATAEYSKPKTFKPFLVDRYCQNLGASTLEAKKVMVCGKNEEGLDREFKVED